MVRATASWIGFGSQAGRSRSKPGLRVAAYRPTWLNFGPVGPGSGSDSFAGLKGSWRMPYQTVFHGEIPVAPAYRKPSICAPTISACADQSPSRSAYVAGPPTALTWVGVA